MSSRRPRHRPRPVAQFDHGQPIRRIELGPMAGVLLVMVACMAFAYPRSTHTLILALDPLITQYPDGTDITPDIPSVVHELAVNPDGSLHLNGSRVSEDELIRQLQLTLSETPRPGLTFEPRGETTYGDVVHVLNILQQSGVTPDHFCLKGMGQYQTFEHRQPGIPRDGLTADQACAAGLARDWSWAF